MTAIPGAGSPRHKAFQKRKKEVHQPIEVAVEAFKQAYSAVYLRVPDYHHYEESSGMIAIYVNSNIKVFGGDLTMLKRRTKQLKDQRKEEARNG